MIRSVALTCLLLCVEGVAMEQPGNPDLISADGVGRIRLGRPLPKDLLPVDAPASYVAGYHADAQPHEGFRLQTPPVTVFLDRGPFLRAARSEAVAAPGPAFWARAMRAAKAGAKVRMILIESAVLKTAQGVGVGSDLKALESAYRDLRLSAVPASFGGDECVATSASIPNVFFYFRTCEAARDDGTVVRVAIFRP